MIQKTELPQVNARTIGLLETLGEVTGEKKASLSCVPTTLAQIKLLLEPA